MRDADIIVQAINDASQWSRRNVIQARVGQLGLDHCTLARRALAELACPSGIAGAAALARLDCFEVADELRQDLEILGRIHHHPDADSATRQAAQATSSTIQELLVSIQQAQIAFI